MSARRIKHGIIAGLTGGMVFGMMMSVMGMLPTIGKMIGLPNPVTGFMLHMIISTFLGAVFAFGLGWLVQGIRSGIVFGLLYGSYWWVLGPLTLMPVLLGRGLGVNWNLAAVLEMLPSLLGHLVYGVILGAGYGWLQNRAIASATRQRPEVIGFEEA